MLQIRIKKGVERREAVVDHVGNGDKQQLAAQPSLQQQGFTPLAEQELLHVGDAAGAHFAIGVTLAQIAAVEIEVRLVQRGGDAHADVAIEPLTAALGAVRHERSGIDTSSCAGAA